MRILVQKFGGTSVATPAGRERVSAHVARALQAGFSPCVVVSAMGRYPEPYATDSLIHLAAASGGRLSARELDLIMSCGETIATVVVTGALLARGIDACALTGAQAGIVTDGGFGQAEVVRVEPVRILRCLEEGRVPVVAGFQGVTDSGEVTTLGRGGSDTTAAVLGAALQAEAVEIYTDVDGVKTADPRLVPGARTLGVVTYDEVAQMAHEGAKVVHPRAVEIAMRAGVPMRIRDTFSEAPGTLVTFTFARQGWSQVRDGRVVTAVTHIPGVARLRVLNPPPGPAGAVHIFRSLAREGISVDMIQVAPGHCAFIVGEEVAERASRVLRQQGMEVEVREGCAKVSVVGSRMRGLPGVMANVAEALERAGVEMLQTADSHVTISCLIAQEDLEKAVRALHHQFGLDG
ncbi:MAG: aspartate kinase [Bacillota bacterium]